VILGCALTRLARHNPIRNTVAVLPKCA
jgi:hypothetical protein